MGEGKKKLFPLIVKIGEEMENYGSEFSSNKERHNTKVSDIKNGVRCFLYSKLFFCNNILIVSEIFPFPKCF